MGIPKRIDAKRAEQARRCYELDLAGFSQRQIAEKIGISQTTVHNRLVEHIQNRVHRKADEWRDRQLDDLMVMRRKLVGAIESGDIKAIGQAVRIWERISKLMGTDSPQQLAVAVSTNDSDGQEVQRMLAEMFGQPTTGQVIPGEVEPTEPPTPRKKRPPYISNVAVTNVGKPKHTPDEFPNAIPANARPAEAQEEFEPEPAPRPKPRRRGKPIPNPAHQFLRDSDDD